LATAKGADEWSPWSGERGEKTKRRTRKKRENDGLRRGRSCNGSDITSVNGVDRIGICIHCSGAAPPVSSGEEGEGRRDAEQGSERRQRNRNGTGA